MAELYSAPFKVVDFKSGPKFKLGGATNTVDVALTFSSNPGGITVILVRQSFPHNVELKRSVSGEPTLALGFIYVAPGSPVLRLRLRNSEGVERTVPAPPNSLVVFRGDTECELASPPALPEPPPVLLRGYVVDRPGG
jgi:hypothetical protein